MKTCVWMIAMAVALTLASRSATAVSAGPEFTYQGQLKLDGRPLTETVDFQYALFDAESGGDQIGTVQSLANVAVSNGLFTVPLDFGEAAFDGSARWLEVRVRSPHDPTDAAPYAALSPRQEITPTPYALKARGIHVDDMGRVGISEPSAFADLEVQDVDGSGNALIRLVDSSGLDMTLESNPSLPGIQQRLKASTNLALNVGGTDRLAIGSNGNVGIGTVNPATRIDVEVPGAQVGITTLLRLGQSTAGATTQDALTGTGLDFFVEDRVWAKMGGGTRGLTTGREGFMSFKTRDASSAAGEMSERMRITGSGNIGIGTTTPQARLEVSGGSEGVRICPQSGRSTAISIQLDGDTPSDQTFFSVGRPGDTDSMGFVFNNESQDSMKFLTASRVRMTMLGNGNVGIGTTSPSAKLDVVGHVEIANSGDGARLITFNMERDWVFEQVGSGSATSLRLRSTVGGQNKNFIIETDGKVVIEGPKLLVKGTVESTAGFKFPDGSVQVTSATGGGGASQWTPSASGIFYNAGNVGIGTSTPGSKLVLQGADNQLLLVQTGNNTAGGIVFNSALGRPGFTFQERDANGGFVDNLVSIFTDGTLRAKVVEITGADLAERFPVKEDITPGMVVAIDPENPGHLRISRTAYSHLVAGVASGANGLSAGAVLGNLPGIEDAPPIALTGRVWCACDASFGAIEPGDLLTTSDTPGHAMKATNHVKSQGAVLGKAMTPLSSGKGFVLVLVTLQ